jgi:hypothetical protein
MELRATKRDIAIILFRFLSVYAFVLAASFVADNFFQLMSADNVHSLQLFARVIGQPLLMIICGVMLWYVAPVLASRLSKDLSEEEVSQFSLTGTLDIAFSAVGLYIVINTVSDIAYEIAVYHKVLQHASGTGNLFKFLVGDLYLMSLALKVILGIWLLIGSKQFVKMIRSLRRD